jgi:hypothetical protein
MTFRKARTRRRVASPLPRRPSLAIRRLPRPLSKTDLGEVGPHMRGSIVLAHGRHSFYFL